jgi:hypothetical protein
MAFPGTYNFNYYRGDTFDFIIRPRDAGGNTFPLEGFTAQMTIADRRGPNPTQQYAAVATIDPLSNIITCKITDAVGRNLTPGVTWVYDVEINNVVSIFTLLTGNITVTDDITDATGAV